MGLNGSTQSILTTLGRLLERTERTAIDVREVKRSVSKLQTDVATMKARQSTAPHYERYAKRALTYGIPALTLYASGSHQEAVKLIGLIRGAEH